MAAKRKRLGDLLVESGIITEEQLQDTLKTKEKNKKLGDALVEKRYITEHQLIEVLEFQLGIPQLSLYRYPIDTNLLSLVPMDLARRKLLIPLRKEGNQLFVAMNDPMDYYAIDDLRMSTGFQIAPAIATKDDILQAINKYYTMQSSSSGVGPADGGTMASNVEDDDTRAVDLVNQILLQGIQLKASDIHIDPHETNVAIRFRVDGVLKTERTLSKVIQSQLTARIKIMANLNITETRLPQDGRIKVSLNMTPVDLRISTLPTVYGDKIVIRILDLSSVLNNLSDLGFNKINHDRFVKLIEQPSGIILITGPTGSGKSSTLYAALNHLNSDEVNIITIEDPVEYQVDGVNQVQVNSKVGLTFAAGLRSILRQDPNIIMIGEIRDTETAEIAIRSSLTGHLVLSTLHTNSAIGAIPRLIDMDIEPYLVVSSLAGIVAQRLVRRVCSDCKQAYTPSEFEKEFCAKRGIDVDKLYRGSGCGNCRGTGYRGRLAIQEILVIDDQIRSLMMTNQSIAKIREYAMRAGMIFLVDDGLLKAKQGLTTIEEILRVAVDE